MIRPEQVWQDEPEAAVTEQQEASEDAVMTRIGQAVILLHAGDREEARNRLGEIWSEIGEEGDSLHRCTLAHYMADAQDDPAASPRLGPSGPHGQKRFRTLPAIAFSSVESPRSERPPIRSYVQS